MSTVYYTYDLKCDGSNVSQVKINGTDIKRLKINGVDVIHKFVNYTTTVNINCYIIFNKIRLIGSYDSCGDTQYEYEYEGSIFANYTYSGVSIDNTDAVIPATIDFYFRRYWVGNHLELYHDTFSNIKLVSESDSLLGYPTGTTVHGFSGTFNKYEDEDTILCGDVYSDGSEMKTSWGNVNISANHHLSEFTNGVVDISTVENVYIKLGSIPRSFTKTVQEY